MQSILGNKMLNFRSDTMISIRTLYNLHKPGEMDKAIDLLDDWIKKQNHFTKKNYSREYLERSIILVKGSIERSKNHLDKICTLRTLLPILFDKSDPKNDFQDLKKLCAHALLPTLTEDNYRVYTLKVLCNGFNSKLCLDCYKYGILKGYYKLFLIVNIYIATKKDLYLQKCQPGVFVRDSTLLRHVYSLLILTLRYISEPQFIKFYKIKLSELIEFCEYLKAHDYCSGLVIILDYRDINLMELIPALNPIELNQYITVLMQGYGMRIKGIHLLSPSKTIGTLIKMFGKMFGPKVSQRLHVHANLETLYDHVPKEILPVEFDGYEKSIVTLNDEWTDCLSERENIEYSKELSKAVSNEAYRQTDKFNEMYMGMAGTFRTLNVD